MVYMCLYVAIQAGGEATVTVPHTVSGALHCQLGEVYVKCVMLTWHEADTTLLMRCDMRPTAMSRHARKCTRAGAQEGEDASHGCERQMAGE